MSTLTRFVLIVFVCSCCQAAVAQTPNAAAPTATAPRENLPTPLETPRAQASYGIGIQVGRNLLQSGFDGELLDLELLLAGIRDGFGNQQPRVTQEQFQAAIGQVQQQLQSKMDKKMQLLGDKNRREGPEFIKRFQAMEGVRALPGGVLYRVLKSGNGPTPTRSDVVRTHYRGCLADGTEFDSSEGGEPAVFGLDEVIRGWTDALLRMKVGDKWQVVVPAELAYGKEGRPPVIGPDAVLLFDIELLGIEPRQAVTPTSPTP
jgi:FKBP-type peptidyl-prolyl cis-trans isomerase FklB